MGRRVEESLKRVYIDPKCVGSYGGVNALRRVTRAPVKAVKQWLSEQDAYSLHKPVRIRFKRRHVIVGGRNHQWQADLVDLSKLKKKQRRIRVSVDGDRRLFKTGLVRSSEKQVGVVSGDGIGRIVGQHRAYNLANRQRFGVPQQIREAFVEGARCPSFLHS